MYRRYREYRQRPRRRREYRPRSIWLRPSVQITILAVAAVVVYLLLQSSAGK